MLKYMLDTNIVIYVFKNRPAKVREALKLHGERVCISSVTLMELMYGAEVSSDPERNIREIESFTARIEVLAYAEEAAAHTGEIRAKLRRAGKKSGSYDVMIAGHARSKGLIVVTNNEKDFQNYEGLLIENWAT